MYTNFVNWLKKLDDKWFAPEYEKEISITTIDIESLLENTKNNHLVANTFLEFSFLRDQVKYRKRIYDPIYNKSPLALLYSENIVEQKQLIERDSNISLSKEQKINLNMFNKNVDRCFFVRSYSVVINDAYKFEFKIKTKLELSNIALESQLFKVENPIVSYMEVEYIWNDKSRIDILLSPKINNLIFRLPPDTIYDNNLEFKSSIKTIFKSPVEILRTKQYDNKIVNIKTDGVHVLFENHQGMLKIMYGKTIRLIVSEFPYDISGEAEYLNNRLYPFVFKDGKTRLESFKHYNSILRDHPSDVFMPIEYFIAAPDLPDFVRQLKSSYEASSIPNDGFVLLDDAPVTESTVDYKFKFDNTIDILAVLNPIQIIETNKIKRYTIKLFYTSIVKKQRQMHFFKEQSVDIKNISIDLKKGYYTYLGYEIPFIAIVEYSLEQGAITRFRANKTNNYLLYGYGGNPASIIKEHIKYYNSGSLTVDKLSLLEYRPLDSVLVSTPGYELTESMVDNTYLKRYEDFVKTTRINSNFFRLNKATICCIGTNLANDLNKYFMIHPKKLILVDTDTTNINQTKSVYNKSSKHAKGNYFELETINNDMFKNQIELKQKCSFEIANRSELYGDKRDLEVLFKNMRLNSNNLCSTISLFDCKRIRELIFAQKKNSVSITIDNVVLSFVIDEFNMITFFVNSEKILTFKKKNLDQIYAEFNENGFRVILEEDYTLVNNYKSILNSFDKYGNKKSSVYNFLSKLNIIEDQDTYNFLKIFKFVTFIKTH